jgi:hypothetical protein
MAVRNVEGALEAVKARRKAAKKKGGAAKKRTRVEPSWHPSQIQLPTKPKKPVKDLRQFAYLLYGREKIGKTTALSSIEDLLFFSTEPGVKGLDNIYEWNEERGGTTSWPIFVAGVEQLERDPGRFKNAGVDTVDRLYQLCSDYMCDEVLRIPGPGVDADGSPDRGTSYKAIAREFTDTLDRILRAGIGLWLTSHVREHEIKKRGGGESTRLSCSMSDSPRRIVEAYVDFIWFADYATDVDGRQRRVVITRGDELITAGSRKLPDGRKFPRYLPLLEDGWYDMLKEQFEGERSHGIDPSTLLSSQKGTHSGTNALADDRAKARLRKKKGGRRVR